MKCEFVIVLRALMPQLMLSTVEQMPWVRDSAQSPLCHFALYFKTTSKLLQFPGDMQGCVSQMRIWTCWEELIRSKDMLPLKEASLYGATTPNSCQNWILRREPLSPSSSTRAYVPQLLVLGWPSLTPFKMHYFVEPHTRDHQIIYACSRFHHNTNNGECSV